MATAFAVPEAARSGGSTAHWGIAPEFDYDTGDIVLDSAGRVEMADKAQSWIEWCQKAMITQRGAYGAYPSFGADMLSAMNAGGREASQAAIANAAADALLNDPCGRTLSVGEFAFEWAGDSAEITFKVCGADGASGNVNARLSAAV